MISEVTSNLDDSLIAGELGKHSRTRHTCLSNLLLKLFLSSLGPHSVLAKGKFHLLMAEFGR